MTIPPHPIVIVGPTAVGKSAISERLAHALGSEVISADSMQIYRGMDIGTAKTPAADRRTPIRCIDLVEPGEPYSAALYQRDARRAIDGLLDRGLAPVVAGGTGLYVRAAIDRFEFPSGELTGPERNQLETHASEIGSKALHAELAAVDPLAAALIHPNNTRRTIRALEMLAQGRSYADQAGGFSAREPYYQGTRWIGISMDRAALYERIDARVREMVADGLLAEVKGLLDAGYREALTAAQAIGYKELVPVLDGKGQLEDAIAEIQQASRRYAKRQLSWFRSDPRVKWLDVTGLSPSDAFGLVVQLLESSETAA